MEKKIGFIGLGQMGKWMARNVVKAGFDLTVFDYESRCGEILDGSGRQGSHLGRGSGRTDGHGSF